MGLGASEASASTATSGLAGLWPRPERLGAAGTSSATGVSGVSTLALARGRRDGDFFGLASSTGAVEVSASLTTSAEASSACGGIWSFAGLRRPRDGFFGAESSAATADVSAVASDPACRTSPVSESRCLLTKMGASTGARWLRRRHSGTAGVAQDEASSSCASWTLLNSRSGIGFFVFDLAGFALEALSGVGSSSDLASSVLASSASLVSATGSASADLPRRPRRERLLGAVFSGAASPSAAALAFSAVSAAGSSSEIEEPLRSASTSGVSSEVGVLRSEPLSREPRRLRLRRRRRPVVGSSSVSSTGRVRRSSSCSSSSSTISISGSNSSVSEKSGSTWMESS